MKFTYALVLALVLTTFGCNNDDDATAINEISVEDLTVTIDENSTNGQLVGTVETDGDGVSSFSITSQTPTGALSVNSSTGEVTVADASLFDFETNPVITATISVAGSTNTGTVTINLNDLNEISAQDVTIDLDENPTDGQSIDTIEVEGGGTLSFSITSQTPAGALSIDESTGELTVADATLFDFETNPVITATISVVDATDPATVTINLNDVVELNAQDLAANIDENPTDGQVVGTVQVNGSGTLSFSIASQTPTGALSIDAGTGELSVVDPNLFDYETNPEIMATILVDNGVETATATATINLNDVDEIVVQNANLNIDENPSNGNVIGTLQATSGGSLTFTITFQNPAGAFNIDQNTGELSVADETLFDYEANPNMLATISVDNGTYSVSANASVALNDVNEIGDFNHGGVVFWVDPTDNNHGLVVAVNNQSFGAPWGCQGITVSPTYSDIGSGAANTVLIESICTTPGTAADLAANLSLNSYNDWFLPSRFELNEYYTNKDIVNATVLANGGAIPNQFHWSSTQSSSNLGAFVVNLTTGVSGSSGKNSNYGVRAVRAF